MKKMYTVYRVRGNCSTSLVSYKNIESAINVKLILEANENDSADLVKTTFRIDTERDYN